MTTSPEVILDALLDHTNVLLYGPPGTGKTWLMNEAAKLFETRVAGDGDTVLAIDTESESQPLVELEETRVKTEWVTFHQSYSYEDFILGLRPDLAESEKLLSLVPRPGILLELAVFAMDGDRSALLLIDEINRGNVSRIFGEFITLLEPEKRLDEHGNRTNSTVMVNLPYLGPNDAVEIVVDTIAREVHRRFSLPPRLYTLASMNSVDKSIAPIDTALRRRFHVVNVPATTDDLASEWGVDRGARRHDGVELTLDDVRRTSLQCLDAFNSGINTFLGVDFGLGQWYLKSLARSDLTVADGVEELARIWHNSLRPQLEELFHGRTEQLSDVLMLDQALDAPLRLVQPSDGRVDLGGRPYLESLETSSKLVYQYLESVGRLSLGATAHEE